MVTNELKDSSDFQLEMSRIILGSSNMQRFYSADKYKEFKPYMMSKTCTLEVFRARMTILDPK
jgi:hypothetical protein